MHSNFSKPNLAWSLEKLQWMEEQLKAANNGYWWQDVWSLSDNPLETTQDHSPTGQRLYFNEFHSISLRREFKFACFEKFRREEWNLNTLHSYCAYSIHLVAELFNQYPQTRSIIDKPLNEWKSVLQTYVSDTEELKLSTSKNTRLAKDDKTKRLNKTDKQSSFLVSVYQIIEEVYDERDEWDKDIVFLHKIGINTQIRAEQKLDFTLISQPWLKEITRKYLKYELENGILQPSSCHIAIETIRNFSRFLVNHYPFIQPSQLTQPIFEDYLNYLKETLQSPENRRRKIRQMDNLFTKNSLYKWIEIPGKLVYPDAYSRGDQLVINEKLIPDIITEQLLKYSHELQEYQRRMLVILAHGGMRISELSRLPFDCLVLNDSGELLLRYYQYKVKAPITKSLASIFNNTDEVIAVIKEQQELIRQKWGNQCPYLFPSPYSGSGNIKPLSSYCFSQALKRLVVTHDIRDENGKYFSIHFHMMCSPAISNLIPKLIMKNRS